MLHLTAGLVDVFADTPLSGNPLAVVEDADGLSEEAFRRIAREFNQAETTFVLRSDRADRRLRSFTASGAEVFGAGHNALGAWLWLADRGLLGPLATPRTFRQEIGADILPITLEARDGRFYGKMKQAPLVLSSEVRDMDSIAESLSVSKNDLVTQPPPVVASTGAWDGHLLVRAKSANVVDHARPATEKLLAVLRSARAEGCYLYSLAEAAPNAAYARFFNPTVGLWEDAATGTAAGPLCGYLGAAGLLAPDNALIVEQGVQLGRRSMLHVRLTPEPEISGSGVVVLRGSLLVATSQKEKTA
jgi:PhzF family phenazine biosynthesis protein